MIPTHVKIVADASIPCKSISIKTTRYLKRLSLITPANWDKLRKWSARAVKNDGGLFLKGLQRVNSVSIFEKNPPEGGREPNKDMWCAVSEKLRSR